MARRPALAIVVFAIALVGACALRVFAAPPGEGAVFAAPLDAVEWSLRLHRVALGVIVGAALAVGGVALQALLRNPLAEPSVLGISAGASLGVMLSVFIAFQATGTVVMHQSPVAASLLGAFGAMALVAGLGQRRGVIEPVSLILVGVVVAVLCGAGIALVQHLLPGQGWAVGARWTLGSLNDDVPRWLVIAVGGATAIGVGVAAWLGPAMDAASLGEDEARSVGLPLGAVRAVLFALAGTLTAGSVLLAGPVGFVGLVCPHAARLVGGPRHRPLVMASALAGGALVVSADAVVRIADLGAGRMPLGILTAIIGAPTFLWLLRSRGGAGA